ncbi:MAG: FkbM family methyltransferase [Thermodesulfobacteriota bacterium]
MGLGLRIRLLLGYHVLKFFAYLFPSFIPVNPLRKRFRSWIFGGLECLHQLRKSGDFELKEVDGVAVAVVNGIHFGNIEKLTESIVAQEVFRGDYHFATQGRAIVIDIGMNCGFASLYFASRDDVEAVYGFELVPSVYESALSNFRLNPQYADKIHAHNYGLGDNEKEIMVDFSESITGWTTIVEHEGKQLFAKSRGYSVTKIPVKVKDAAIEIGNIIERHPNERVVIKCDCEGAEKEIFARLDEKGLLSAIDIVLMEYHFEYDQFITPLLDKYGFSYFKRNDSTNSGLIRAVKT